MTNKLRQGYIVDIFKYGSITNVKEQQKRK